MSLDDKTKQDMESGLEHAVRVVRARFTRLEQNVFIPCMESSRNFGSQYPIIATFISIFSILSLFPVLSFVGFALFVSATFTFTALVGAFLVSLLLIIAAAGVLAITLGVLLIASMSLTIVVVSIFITARLGQHLRSETSLRQGIADWAQETRVRLSLRGAHAAKPEITHAKVKDETGGKSGSDEWQAVNNGHL